MTLLIAAVGVGVLGVGMLLIAFTLADIRDELITLRQDLMVMMKRNTPQGASADVGAYMERQLKEQGRWKEKP